MERKASAQILSVVQSLCNAFFFDMNKALDVLPNSLLLLKFFQSISATHYKSLQLRLVGPSTMVGR